MNKFEFFQNIQLAENGAVEVVSVSGMTDETITTPGSQKEFFEQIQLDEDGKLKVYIKSGVEPTPTPTPTITVTPGLSPTPTPTPTITPTTSATQPEFLYQTNFSTNPPSGYITCDRQFTGGTGNRNWKVSKFDRFGVDRTNLILTILSQTNFSFGTSVTQFIGVNVSNVTESTYISFETTLIGISNPSTITQDTICTIAGY